MRTTTQKGRVVYDRKKHYFGYMAYIRVLKNAILDRALSTWTPEQITDIIESHNTFGSWLRFQLQTTLPSLQILKVKQLLWREIVANWNAIWDENPKPPSGGIT